MTWGREKREEPVRLLEKTHRRPDKGDIGDGVDDGERRGLLLAGLATRSADPAQDDRVDGVGTDRKDNHGEVARPHIYCGHAQDETEDGHRLGRGDVPRPLIVATRLPGPVD